jgi:hypothetical protein
VKERSAALRERLSAEAERLEDAARDLRLHAASWREASDMTGGYTAVKLISDALGNEQRAGEAEAIAELLREAAASLSPKPAPAVEQSTIETLRADALYEALRRLNDGLPQVDNGYCAICKVGYRSYDTHGRPLYNCSNEECVSHEVYRALLMRSAELTALQTGGGDAHASGR